ncbi:MAG: serine hydrolase [Chromatiales bacterium]
MKKHHALFLLAAWPALPVFAVSDTDLRTAGSDMATPPAAASTPLADAPAAIVPPEPGAAPTVIVPAPPALKARAWMLVDFHSGRVLAESNADARTEPASLTKMMTIYSVATLLKEGRVKLTDLVPISPKARSMIGSRMFVEGGSRVTLEELMKGDIIQSGNDASVALAEYVGGAEGAFASMMNQNAVRLRMAGTHFTNSTGLPDLNHYTTARDLARLAVALIRDHPDIYQWFSIKEFTHGNITQPNRNKLLWRDPSVDGIKTGYHEAAGYCLAASALRDGMRLIAIVLGTESEAARADAAQALLNYGFQFHETRKLFTAAQPIKNTRVWKGEGDSVALGVQEDLYVTYPRGLARHLKSVIQLDGKLIAPIQVGDVHGQLQVSLDGGVIAEQPVVALQTVAAGGLVGRTVDTVRLWFE